MVVVTREPMPAGCVSSGDAWAEAGWSPSTSAGGVQVKHEPKDHLAMLYMNSWLVALLDGRQSFYIRDVYTN